MAPPNVQEPTGPRATAAELRRLADVFDGLPDDGRMMPVYVTVFGNDRIDDLDALSVALTGAKGRVQPSSSTTGFSYVAFDERSRVAVQVRATVDAPADSDVARLRAEVIYLRTKRRT